MLNQETVLNIFAENLNAWSQRDLEDAVKKNMSLANELQVHRSRELQMWRGLASSYRLFNRRDYDRFVNGINYHSVIGAVRKANPELAYAVQITKGADVWLLEQVKTVKALVLG